uniref:Fatty acid desaturase domain-containing protein n=1 Tax=Cucumis sativus TaxID=3659 RepID=A0A0A0KTL6_CUCSA
MVNLVYFRKYIFVLTYLTLLYLLMQCVRIVMLYHVIFMVNSVCHKWGKKQWSTTDLSRNNWWVSLLSFGEGWHNNHHAFEYSAKYGLEWWQLDFGWYVIMFLKAIGVATDVKLPTQCHKQRMKL